MHARTHAPFWKENRHAFFFGDLFFSFHLLDVVGRFEPDHLPGPAEFRPHPLQRVVEAQAGEAVGAAGRGDRVASGDGGVAAEGRVAVRAEADGHLGAAAVVDGDPGRVATRGAAAVSSSLAPMLRVSLVRGRSGKPAFSLVFSSSVSSEQPPHLPANPARVDMNRQAKTSTGVSQI